MKRILEFDGLRAIAITLIVACHYPAIATSLYSLPGQVGWIGVDIFFVLSGFLITSILLRLRDIPHPFLVFYARRTLRIFPAYFLVLGLVCLLAIAIRPEKWHLITGVFLHNASFASSMVESRRFILSCIPVLTANHFRSFASPAGGLPPIMLGHADHLEFTLVPFWSLSVEEWFYILWAPIMLLFSRRNIVIAAITISLLCCMTRALGPDGREWHGAFCCRLDELLLGALLAIWTERKGIISIDSYRLANRLIAIVSSVALILLICILFYIHPSLGADVRGSRLFSTFGPLLIGTALVGLLNLILCASFANCFLNRFLRSKPLVYVGQRSYMLYLIHSPIYFITSHVFSNRLTNSPLAEYAFAVISILMSLFLSAISWRIFERPILDLKEVWISTLLIRAGFAKQAFKL